MSFIYVNKGLKSGFIEPNNSDSIKEFNIVKDYSGLDSVYYSPYKSEIVQTSINYRFTIDAAKEYWAKFTVVCPNSINTIGIDGDILWGFQPKNIYRGIYIARDSATSNRYYVYDQTGTKISNDYFLLDFTSTIEKSGISDYLVCPYNEISVHIKSDSTNGLFYVYNGYKKVFEYDGNILNGLDLETATFGGCNNVNATPENATSYSGIIISSGSKNILNVKIPYKDPNLGNTFDNTWENVLSDDGLSIVGHKTSAVGSSFDIALSDVAIDQNNEAANGIDSIIIPLSGTFVSDIDNTMNGVNIYAINNSTLAKTLLDTILFSEDGSFNTQVRLTTNPFTNKPFTVSDFNTIKIRIQTAKII